MNLSKIGIHSPALLIFIAFCGSTLAFFFNMFMTRHTSTAMYGDFSLAKQFLAFGSSLCIYGTTASLMRFSKIIKKESKAPLIQWAISVVRGKSILLFTLLGPFALLLYCMHHFNIYTYDKYHLAVGLLTTAPIIALYTIIVTNLNIEKRSMQSQIFGKIFPYGLLILIGLSAAYFLSKDFGNSTIIMLYMATYLIITSCVAFYYYFFCQPQSFINVALNTRPKDLDNEKKWLSFTRKSFFITIVFNMTFIIEIMSIELICNKEALLGIYSVCFPIVAFYSLITFNFLYAIKPHIAKLLQSDEGKETLQKAYNKAFCIGFILMLCLSIIIALYHQSILGYFGDAYKAADKVLLILSLNYIILFLLYGPIIFLFYSGHENFSLRTNIFQISILVILCPILTYYFSIIGTALSACIVYFIGRLYLLIQCKKYIKFKFFIWF